MSSPQLDFSSEPSTRETIPHNSSKCNPPRLLRVSLRSHQSIAVRPQSLRNFRRASRLPPRALFHPSIRREISRSETMAHILGLAKSHPPFSRQLRAFLSLPGSCAARPLLSTCGLKSTPNRTSATAITPPACAAPHPVSRTKYSTRAFEASPDE